MKFLIKARALLNIHKSVLLTEKTLFQLLGPDELSSIKLSMFLLVVYIAGLLDASTCILKFVLAAISCRQGWQNKGYISWLLPFVHVLMSVTIQNSLKAPSKICNNGQKVATLE